VFGAELAVALLAIFCFAVSCLIQASLQLGASLRPPDTGSEGGLTIQAEAAVAEAMRLVGLNGRTKS
jgi:hypothetical protein